MEFHMPYGTLFMELCSKLLEGVLADNYVIWPYQDHITMTWCLWWIYMECFEGFSKNSDLPLKKHKQAYSFPWNFEIRIKIRSYTCQAVKLGAPTLQVLQIFVKKFQNCNKWLQVFNCLWKSANDFVSQIRVRPKFMENSVNIVVEIHKHFKFLII